MRLRHTNKAFSLAEVLITVAILSSAIVLLLQSFTTSLSATRLSQHIELASLLAESQLLDVIQNYAGGNELPGGSTKQEKIEGLNFDLNFQLSDTDYTGLKKLTLVVSWPENMREKPYSVEVATYLYKEP